MDKLIDCNSEEGVTIGLIDAIISISKMLSTRNLFDDRDLIHEALKDLRSTEDMKMLMDIGELEDAKNYIKEKDKIIDTLSKAIEQLKQNPSQEQEQKYFEELKLLKTAVQWMWDNLKDELHPQDSFNTPANAMGTIDRLISSQEGVQREGVSAETLYTALKELTEQYELVTKDYLASQKLKHKWDEWSKDFAAYQKALKVLEQYTQFPVQNNRRHIEECEMNAESFLNLFIGATAYNELPAQVREQILAALEQYQPSSLPSEVLDKVVWVEGHGDSLTDLEGHPDGETPVFLKQTTISELISKQ